MGDYKHSAATVLALTNGNSRTQTPIRTSLRPAVTNATVRARMKPSPDDALPQAQFLELHFPRLVALAISEYHIPESEAGQLVHDLILVQLFRRSAPADAESWLNDALRSAAHSLAGVRA